MIVPKPAATIMLVRDGASGLEVLMLRRNLASSWVGGVHLFPGGAVDPADGSPSILERTVGLDDEAASRVLEVEEGGLASFVAAIRECFEEAGVLLARCSGGPIDPADRDLTKRLVEWRRRLNAEEVTFSSLLEEEDLYLEAGRLCYFSHWITPEGSPRRYDTRFFVAACPEGQTALHDDVEVIDSIWIEPAEALSRQREGEIEMLLPTEQNLEAVGRFASTGELLEAAGARQVDTVLPKVVVAEQGVRILLPGDEGYETARPAPEGAGFPDRSS